MTEEIVKITTEKTPEDVKELVIARLDVLPEGNKISIGGEGEFTKANLIEHVTQDDEIGKTVVSAELTFLKALKEGSLLSGVLTETQGK